MDGLLLVFFFSSRRRHTRLTCDWSSDVCSSDLSFHFVADWHMLTTDYANTSELQNNIREMVTDWLAAGLDPKKATFFIQSRILEHAELHLIFSMITPLGWLERVPSYKEQLE